MKNTRKDGLLLEAKIQVARDELYYLVCSIEDGEPFHYGQPCKNVEEVLRLMKMFLDGIEDR
jgi:hypothetical protein